MTISFREYKINFNNCLGIGTYGSIYEVVKRPSCEKGCLSSTFPYFYDYYFRVKEAEKQETDYCIKITKTACRILRETDSTVYPCQSFFEPTAEKRTNQILRKYGITNISFYEHGLYYQFKTRIFGRAFSHNVINFQDKTKFAMRRAFVDFLSRFSHAPIGFRDVSFANVMYDERHECWEIVDGTIWEDVQQEGSPRAKIDALYDSLWILGEENKHRKHIFEQLALAAISNKPYTEQIDQQIFK